ncbi:MAG: hypothetical protein IJN90_02465 [Bacilli bacterium]|nr:hypothetical protein [Bacilli bacterium]
MNLKEQLLTIFISILYGFFTYLLFYINRNILSNKNILKKIIINLLFVLDLVLMYFIIIKKINDGVLTYYSYICIIIGILLQKYIINIKKTYKK